MSERLPLFPLGTVLFPGLVLPLNIFEERYRTMVRDLRALPEGSPRRFGVVAIRSGRETGADGALELYEVGCAADIHVAEEHTDGRFELVTTGTRRFRLLSVDRTLPYLQGEVEFLPEGVGDDAPVLALSASRAFRAYQRLLLASRDELMSHLPELPSDPGVLSYLIAVTMVLDMKDKQALLEAGDAAARLRLALRLLHRETGIIKALPSLPAVDLVRPQGGRGGFLN